VFYRLPQRLVALAPTLSMYHRYSADRLESTRGIMRQTPSSPSALRRARQVVARAAGFAIAWLVITEVDSHALIPGVALSVAAALLSLALQPQLAPRVHLAGLVRFMLFFAVHSAIGGVDVAFRALSPRMPLNPTCLCYPLRVDGGPATVLFANVLSLLPGTLGARLSGGTLEVHVLDYTPSTVADLARVEERVAGIFGIILPELSERTVN